MRWLSDVVGACLHYVAYNQTEALCGAKSAFHEGTFNREYCPQCSDILDKSPNRLTGFEELGRELGDFTEWKNIVYGDSFRRSGEFLRLLYPNGVTPEQFDDMLFIIRVFDKQMRIATAPTALGENPAKDIVGYGLLQILKNASD